MTVPLFRSTIQMKTEAGDETMEEKTTKPILTDDTVVEDKEVPFEDLISELRY